MKKRVFSILLAVIMAVTAINLLPVQQVLATVGHGTANTNQGGKYEWDYSEGHWDASGVRGGSLYCYNDGDYANTVETYTTNSKTEDFRTRHVTIFNACDSDYNQEYDEKTDGTPYHQIKYTYSATAKTNVFNVSGHWLTQRGVVFNTEDKSADTSESSLAYKDQAPFLIAGSGCKVYRNSGQHQAYFYLDTNVGAGADYRMVFRNYNNSDYTRYNGTGRNEAISSTNTSMRNKLGMDISQYDYLEFDVKLGSALKWGQTSRASAYKVYFYYETNSGSGQFISSDRCIEGYKESNADFDFRSQINKNSTDWQTVRIPLRSLKGLSKAPTVKQIIIRMADGNAAVSAGTGGIAIDDLRFVKNDDHVGVAYTHDGNGNKITDGSNAYPSGDYYMINDFEFNGSNRNYANHSHAYKSATLSTHQGQKIYSGNWVKYIPVIRQTDANLMDSHGVNQHTGNDCINGVGTEDGGKNFVGGKNTVTQGDYALGLETPEYQNRSKILAQQGWHNPAYYEREYSSGINLSDFTHFAIDVTVRTPFPDKNNNKGIRRPNNSAAKGVVFCLALYDKDTVNDGYNYTSGASVKFFLPFGEDPWSYTGDKPGDDNNYGTILALGSDYNSGKGITGRTSHGTMRFVFTREQLLSGMDAKGGVDLSNITAMRFVWLNRIPSADPTNTEYYSFPFGDRPGDISYGANDTSEALRYQLILDNFIGYTPDMTLTLQNQITDTSLMDEDQSFLYNLYGGYVSSDGGGYITENHLGTVKSAYSHYAKKDTITQGVNQTLSIPANGSVTIRNLPFNSYYVSRQNWGWRYTVSNISLTGDPFSEEEKKKVFGGYTPGSNTAALLPRMSLNGSCNRNLPIWEIMKQRNLTLTFTLENAKKEDGTPKNQWLDGADTCQNAYN